MTLAFLLEKGVTKLSAPTSANTVNVSTVMIPVDIFVLLCHKKATVELARTISTFCYALRRCRLVGPFASPFLTSALVTESAVASVAPLWP